MPQVDGIEIIRRNHAGRRDEVPPSPPRPEDGTINLFKQEGDQRAAFEVRASSAGVVLQASVSVLDELPFDSLPSGRKVWPRPK
jgi:hypothetical protein